MKLLQITALALCLNAPFSYGMDDDKNTNQCSLPIGLTCCATLSAGGIAYLSHRLNASLKEKVKKACNAKRTEWEEGEVHDEEAAHHPVRRRFTPEEARQMKENVLLHTQLRVIDGTTLYEDFNELTVSALSCCAGACVAGLWAFIECLDLK